MARNLAPRAALLACLLWLASVACGSQAGSGTDSNTHWLSCTTTLDCTPHGEDLACVDRRCVSITGEGPFPGPAEDAGNFLAGDAGSSAPPPQTLGPALCEVGVDCTQIGCGMSAAPVPVNEPSEGSAGCCVCGRDPELGGGAGAADCAGGELLELASGELANRLSLMLWGAPADAALQARAETVTTRGAVGCLAREMLGDQRTRAGLEPFIQSWLGLNAAFEIDPDYYPVAALDFEQAARRETVLFVERALLEEAGTVRELLTARYAFANQPLRVVYGLEPNNSEALEPVILPPTRPGLLTRAFFLASNTINRHYSSPTRRGETLNATLLCYGIPPEPPGIREPAVASAEPISRREQYENLMGKDNCTSCHALMDPLGFAFEPFDAVGALRYDDEAGFLIDPSGEVWTRTLVGPNADDPGHAALAFADHRQLVEILASHDRVGACFALRWLDYLRGSDPRRQLAQVIDEPDLATALDYVVGRALLAEGGFSLREALVAALETEVFLAP